jgi:hypothetical protein
MTMKYYFIFFISVILLAANPLSGQSRFPSAHGYWEGDWGGDMPFNIYLEPGEGGVMTGTITWSLQYYDPETDKMIDTYPKEFLKGKWNDKTGMLVLSTIGEEDPLGLLVYGNYQMQMDASGAVMNGFTTAVANGGFQTQIIMSRIRT